MVILYSIKSIFSPLPYSPFLLLLFIFLTEAIANISYCKYCLFTYMLLTTLMSLIQYIFYIFNQHLQNKIELLNSTDILQNCKSDNDTVCNMCYRIKGINIKF